MRKRHSSTISLCSLSRGLPMLMDAFCHGTRRASMPDVDATAPVRPSARPSSTSSNAATLRHEATDCWCGCGFARHARRGGGAPALLA